MIEKLDVPRFDNLPVPLSTFIGREQEVASLKQLLLENRLVTLTGVGGSGKTRLAIKIANELLNKFEHGTWFIEFAPLNDESLVIETAASILGVREKKNQILIDALIDHLQNRHVLLIFDNCEHLINACAQLAEKLLSVCANIQILATSREPLKISGEVVWAVPPLSLPDPQLWRNPESSDSAIPIYLEAEAVQLFVERARLTSPDFSLMNSNGAWIAEICRCLDGMPLAIELAAAHVHALSVQQIAERLDNRFRFLKSEVRDLPRRQKTIRAAIDWSYELLNDAEKELFAQLGVFVGGWTLEAAEAVCGGELNIDVLNGLESLLDKSLLAPVKKPNGEARFAMLETIHEYARKKLSASGEVETLRRRHARYFASWVDQMAMELRAAPTQMDRFNQLEAEQCNIDAVLEWLLSSGNSELGLKMIGWIFYYWWRAGHWIEWEHWMALVPAHMDRVSDATRAAALTAMSGRNVYIKRDLEAARQHAREALEIYRRLGDRRNIAWALFWLTQSSIDLMGDAKEYARAIASTEEGIELLRQEDDLAGVAQGISNIGVYAHDYGSLEQEKAAYQESLEIARQIHDELREHIQYLNLGTIVMDEGDYKTAMTLIRRGLVWAKEQENLPLILSGLFSMSQYWLQQDQNSRVVRLLGAQDAFSEKSGVKIQPNEQKDYDDCLATVRERLGDQAFKYLWAEGQAMSLEQVMDYAFEQTIQGEKEKAFGGLTPREREVVALIAQGKSNREIAKEMTVRTKTIETYVTRILNKLNLNSRVQIATWALEKGLSSPDSS